MQSTASCWEVNLLTQCLQKNLSSTCVYPGFLGAAPSFGERSPSYKVQWDFSFPYVSVVLCFASWLLLVCALSSLVASHSDGLGFAFGRTCALLAAELIHVYGPITHSWLFLPVKVLEKIFLHWKEDQDLSRSLY